MWVYVLYIIWLMSLAYVDYKTGYVYSRMSVAGIIPACICIVRLITDYRDNICDAFGCILVMILLARLAGHFNLAGGGDSDVLVITSVVNTVIHSQTYKACELETYENGQRLPAASKHIYVYRDIGNYHSASLQLKTNDI